MVHYVLVGVALCAVAGLVGYALILGYSCGFFLRMALASCCLESNEPIANMQTTGR